MTLMVTTGEVVMHAVTTGHQDRPLRELRRGNFQVGGGG